MSQCPTNSTFETPTKVYRMTPVSLDIFIIVLIFNEPVGVEYERQHHSIEAVEQKTGCVTLAHISWCGVVVYTRSTEHSGIISL